MEPSKAITNTAVPITFAAPVVMYGVGLLESDSALKQKAIYIGASVVASGVLTTILKKAVNRPRPFVTYPDIEKNYRMVAAALFLPDTLHQLSRWRLH